MKFQSRFFLWIGTAVLFSMGLSSCEKHHFEDTRVLYEGHGSHDADEHHDDETAEESAAAEEASAEPGQARDVGL